MIETSPPDGGAVLQDEDRAAFALAQHAHDEYQRYFDGVTVAILGTAWQGSASVQFSAQEGAIHNFNYAVKQIMGVEVREEAEMVTGGTEVGPNKLRMVYCFETMKRGDYAATTDQMAEMWVGMGVAKRVSEEEFAGAVAHVESRQNADTQDHA